MQCQSCSAENTPNSKFCENCGTSFIPDTNLLGSPAKTMPSVGKNAANTNPNSQFTSSNFRHSYESKPPSSRNYFLWFFSGFLTLGISYFYYHYLTIKDMNSLSALSNHDYSHLPEGQTYDTYVSDFDDFLGWRVVLFPLYYKMKFDKLTNHLKYVHRSIYLPPTGTKVRNILIISCFFFFHYFS